MRLKRWTLAMGKRERERLQSLQNLVPPTDIPQPRKELDEIACERGVELLPERGGMWPVIFCVMMIPSRGFSPAGRSSSNSTTCYDACPDNPTHHG